ncbi:MAG: hypothetical protein U0X91_12950 [Spirosomataceae bacterium]
MNTTCQHCRCCFKSEEVANAHTVYTAQEGKVMFSSTDDEFGIDICQVCHKPPFVAGLWHKILGSPSVSAMDRGKDFCPEVVVVKL